MPLLEWLLSWLAGFSQALLGFVVGAIITGIFTYKVVLPKVLANKDVKDLLQNIKEGNELLTKALPIWKEILENQKEKNKKQKGKR